MKKLFAALTLALSALPLTAAAMGFSDVSKSTDYYDDIMWTVNEDITSGYENGNWGPNNCVTRAEMLKMLLEYQNTPLQSNSHSMFTDVSTDDWHYTYILTAYNAEIIEGYADRTFKPNQCMNRVEGMKIAVETLIPNPSENGVIRGSAPLYYDDKAISDMVGSAWYSDYSRFLFENRLIGTKHTVFTSQPMDNLRTINFFPADAMTRKEVAHMIHQIASHIENM